MGVYIPHTSYDYTQMQGPAPDGFHVPLNTEWQAVYDVWTALGGGSSDGTNFGIALKLPFAGYRYRSSAGVTSQGSYGYCWSSSRYNADYAYFLGFGSTSINPQNARYRADGFSVRCFKNSPVIPTSSWTKLYGTSIESGGIFWSSTDGLISLSSDGQTWITIADKNLGATIVWNSGDTLSEANCGKYYQRGNNYGFPRTGSVTTSSTQVDASSYGPGNYYSSGTFIKYTGRWDTTDNGNLRGGVTGVKPMSELKNAYIGEVWTPGSNTLLYMPLNGDTKDEVSGNSGTWSGTAQYQTLASGLKVANCNSSSYILTPSITTNAPITISGWLYRVDGNVIFRSDSKNGTRNLWQIAINGRTSDPQGAGGGIYYNGTGYLYYSGTNTGWKYIVVTLGSDGVKIYVNGELTYTYNYTSFAGKTQQWGINFDQYSTSLPIPGAGYYSNLIIENKVWTAEQVAGYYNLTKGNYGL